MAGHNPTLVKSYAAGAAVAARRIVKHGASAGLAIQGADAAAALIGVTTEVAAASGERCDVIKAGLADVEYGGNVALGAPLTSDASGKAVTAAPAGGANAFIIGFAEVDGVSGDIGTVFIAPGRIQG